MRLAAFLPALLALAANAQYFSEGWQPGQPVPTVEPQPQVGRGPRAVPHAPGYAGEKPTLMGVLSGLFEKAGINITERLANATKNAEPGWDERVPLITDANYEDLVVHEELTPEEEDERVWFIVVSATSSQSGGLSKYADQAFDQAFNESLVENDLPNVRWGRIDYLNVTGITTRWNVWQAPIYVILTSRGTTLRFYKPRTLRPHAPTLRTFLLTRAYLAHAPWASPFAPGGPRAWVLDYLARVLTRVYDTMVVIPRWLLMLVTGGAGTVVLNLFHRSDGRKKEEAGRKRSEAERRALVAKRALAEKAAAESKEGTKASAPPPSSASPSKKSKGKKGGKK